MRRYVHGAGSDDPIVWYEGSGINSSTRRFLMADERGSVVSVTDSAGATIAINSYDGVADGRRPIWHPRPDQYGAVRLYASIAPCRGHGKTRSQMWLPELKLWYYKARIYSPTLGRFLQTDPIGYKDGINWYAYVGNDPVNRVDPDGMRFGWLVKLIDGGVKKLKKLSEKQMVQERKKGNNVLASTRQQAGRVERQVGNDPNGTLRHSGHNLKDVDGKPTGETGRPHFQTEGQTGHTFWSVFATGLTGIATILDGVDQLTNPLYVTEMGSGTCPPQGCGPVSAPDQPKEPAPVPDQPKPKEEEDKKDE